MPILVAVLALILVYIGPTAAHAAQPLLLVSYTTEPEQIAPGDEFTLTLALKNEGAVVAKNVLVGLGLASALPQAETTTTGGQATQGGAGLPVSSLGTSNVKFVGEVAAGRTKEVEFKLVTSGSARSGTYNLQIRLDYEDSAGVQRASTQTIGLMILRKPDIKIVRVRMPDEVAAGKAFQILAQVVNTGNFPVAGVTVELLSENLDVTDGELFIGTLEEGDADTLKARVTASSLGEKKAKIRVTYRDDFNRERTIERAVTVTVGKVTAAGEPQTKGAWQRVVGFFKRLVGIGEKN